MYNQEAPVSSSYQQLIIRFQLGVITMNSSKTAAAVIEDTQYFEDTLITATVIAVVLIIIITIVIVVCILCKTPPKTTREGRRSNSLKKRVKDIYHKYWNVQDYNAPRGITRADMPQGPMEMAGTIYTEKMAKKKANEDGCYYVSNQG